MPGRPRVLLVDDYPDFVKALGRVLAPDCDIVGTLADGRQAADAAARLQPVVVVMDVNLPHVSGLDICREITQGTPGVKVIMITASIDDAIADEAMAAGASGFCSKSAVEELIAAIGQAWTA